MVTATRQSQLFGDPQLREYMLTPDVMCETKNCQSKKPHSFSAVTLAKENRF